MFKRDKRISNSEPLKVWCCSFIAIFVFCLVSYGYFVREMTVNLVNRQNMENDLSSLNSKVLDLESEYIKAKNSITPKLATNLGFVPVTNQKFVTKNVAYPGLSLITPKR
jgi:hypothetical protein